MARRPNRSSTPSRNNAGSVRRDAPREHMPRGTFDVARGLRKLAESMPNLLTDKAVRAAKAADAPSGQSIRAISTAKKAAVVNRPNERSVSDRKPDEKPDDRRVDNPTCKSRPKSQRGSGNGRSFVPWCK